MKTQLTWKRAAFSTTNEILSKGLSIGQLQDNAFKPGGASLTKMESC